MELSFILSKKKPAVVNNLKLIYEKPQIFLYANQQLNLFGNEKNKQIGILIDGYVVPRLKLNLDFQFNSQAELIYHLFSKYSYNFVKYIKGIFTVLIVDNEEFFIVNDHHSLKKFFYTQNKNFIISNNLKFISNNLSTSINETSLKLHSLYQHFVDGQTFIKDIYYSKAASRIRFTEGSLTINQYWTWENLSDLSTKTIEYKDFSDKFSQIINQYITYLKPSNLSLTLTGGRDTRSILAALLSLGHKPKTFTFGHKNSSDAISALSQAENCNLDFIVHNNDSPDKKWYSDLSNEIIETGNSMVHIHRAHRLDAIKKEQIRSEKTQCFF